MKYASKNRRFLIGAILFVAAMSGVGCGHTESHVALLREALPPSNHVDVFLASEPVTRPYSEMALVQAIGYGNDMDVGHLVVALRDRAEALGCDGVVNVQIDVGYMRAQAAGTCVKFLASSSEPAHVTTIDEKTAAPPPVEAAPPIHPAVPPVSRSVDNPGAPF